MASDFDDETDNILSGLDTTPDALGLLASPSGSPYSKKRNCRSTSGPVSSSFSENRSYLDRTGETSRTDVPSTRTFTTPRTVDAVGRDFPSRTMPTAGSRGDGTTARRTYASTSSRVVGTSGSTIRSERVATPSSGEMTSRTTAGDSNFLQPRRGPLPNRQPQLSTSHSTSGFNSRSSSSSTSIHRQEYRSYSYTPTVSSAICRRRGVVPRPSPLDIYRDAIDERDVPTGLTNLADSGSSSSTPSIGMRTRLPEPDVRRESDLDEGAVSEGVVTETDDDSQEIVTVVVSYGGKIGLAYYDSDTQIIHLMKDLVDPGDYSSLKKLVMRLGCRTIVTSVKMEDAFLNALHRALKPEATDESWKNDKLVEVVPNPEFDLEAAKRRILAHAHFLPEHYNDTQRAIRMNSIIPFQNVCMVRSAGALIKYLTNKRIGVNLHDDDGSVRVLGYKTFSLEDMLYVDEDSYCSLDIMRPKISHSARFKNKMTYTEQEISLLGLMNRCRSYIGAKLLKKWFQHPITNRDVLKERLDSVAALMNTALADSVAKMRGGVRCISSVAPILVKMAQNGITLKEWKCLYNTVSNAYKVAEAIKDGGLTGGIFTRIREAFGNDVSRLKRFIDEIVDFEAFALKGRFAVRPGLDPDLDEKKRNYYGLPALMTDIANEELLKLPPDVDECSVNYVPQIGYLLCIPFTKRMLEADDFEVDDFALQFKHRGVAHYKNSKMLHLDYALGDLLMDIIDHEMHIMYRLQDSFIALSPTLHQVVALVAELDCLMSFASCAQEFSWVRPRYTDEDTIRIVDGRHPIMEQRVDQFVSNDYFSSPDEEGKIKIITGPNISGKSVYLKQVALIVFMAHLGSYVPAKSAVLGPVDNIFTCIWSKESVSTGLSSFMVDINMMFRACREATSRSLVVVDEFGKGTEMTDGLALLVATIKSFVDLDTRSPHGLFSTHFHEIVQQNLLPRSRMLKFQMMSVLEMGRELVLLYKLVEGSANFSHALHVASRMGLDDCVIDRAKDVTQRILKRQKLYPDETEHEKQLHDEAKQVVDALFELDLNSSDTTALQKFLEDLRNPKAAEFFTTPEGSEDSDFIH